MLHALSARLIGMISLLIAADVIVRVLLPVFRGETARPPLNLMFLCSIVVLCCLLALIFLIPSRTRRTLRTRVNPLPRLFAKITILAVVLLVLFAGIYPLRFFFLSSNLELLILLLSFGAILVVFVHGFIFPGRYAMSLALRFHGLSDPHEPHGVYGQPPQEDGAWRSRVLARHGAIDRAERRAHAAGGVGAGSLLNPGMTLLTISLIFCAIGVYGGAYAHFLPDAAHMKWSLQAQWAIILVMPVLTALALAAWPPRGALVGRTGLFICGLILSGLFWFIAAVAALPHGLPALHSLAFRGESITLRVDVVQLSAKEVNRGRCNRSTYISAPGKFDSGKRVICDVPAHVWGRLQVGSQLTLIGHRTAYGMRYEEIQR